MSNPVISAEQSMAELTFRSILLAIILTVILATSNAYLALKLGILTSASIPAAIISMGVLRFFKNATILENNAVQTAASAGEAVAGGIVYTIPALIMIEYWHQFDYWTNFFIALSGGVLGVLFSIPLRRVLVNEPMLRFPEGRAIAEVLKSSNNKESFKHLVWGGLVGGVFELCQVGFKLLASSWGYWFVLKRTLFGLSIGFSATMIGAGFLVGQDMAISILLGAIIAWFICLPSVSYIHFEVIQHQSAHDAMMTLWESDIRYLGIGAMLFAGSWTFIKLLKPLCQRVLVSLQTISRKTHQKQLVLRTDKDIPLPFIVAGVTLLAVALYLFFKGIFPITQIGFDGAHIPYIAAGAVVYVVIMGFLFSVITAYFSGMVGVTASPGSSVVIAGILFAAWLLLCALKLWVSHPLGEEALKAIEAITIIIGSIVTGIAAIANDNTQDLKVGQLVGATPWKQQIMLLVGVLVSSLVIPPVMHLLFDVYGIAGIMPHEGMDASQSLPAPTAALLAAITTAVFNHQLPWNMMLWGASMIALLMVVHHLLNMSRLFNLSVLGVAVGMYLPLSSSVPLFIGGMMAFLAQQSMNKKASLVEDNSKKQVGTLIACGLVAGAALIDVLLACVFSLSHSQDILSVVGPSWKLYGVLLSVFSVLILGRWIIRRTALMSQSMNRNE
jgi:putative OPT family oligopeptide transporter